MPNIHELEHGSLCRYHDDEEFCDCGQLAWSTVDEQKARIAALEAEVAQLKSGITPPKTPMEHGFSLDKFMPGLKPEDADSFAEALDQYFAERNQSCPRCALLEAALAKAEEALKQNRDLLVQSPDSEYPGLVLSRTAAALAAIRVARQDASKEAPNG